MKEKDILYENGPYWVMKAKDGYYAMVSGITCSISDSCYNCITLAKARVDYFARTHVEGRNLRLAERLGMFKLFKDQS